MAKKHSYEITKKNNRTENEAVEFLLSSDERFILPTAEQRKQALHNLGLEKKYSRAFDLFLCVSENEHCIEQGEIQFEDVRLVELKTTKKKLENNPRGFFFGATKNEFDLAQKMGDKYLFCFVSLHEESLSYAMLSLSEVEELITTKRIQYQINLRR